MARGADVRAEDLAGVTLLHVAAQNGDTEMVKVLCRLVECWLEGRRLDVI